MQDSEDRCLVEIVEFIETRALITTYYEYGISLYNMTLYVPGPNDKVRAISVFNKEIQVRKIFDRHHIKRYWK